MTNNLAIVSNQILHIHKNLGWNEKKIFKHTEQIDLKLNADEFENRFSKETVNISNKVRSNLEAFEYKIQKIENNIQESIVKF